MSSWHSQEGNWECWLTFTFTLYIDVTHCNRKSYIFWSCLQNTSIMQDHETRQTPQKHIWWFNNRQVTQITHAAPYKHLALLFSDSSQLCIYMTSPHILAPTVWICYQDYFQSTPIHSYPSTSSLVYYYTKVLLSRNYFHWSFIEKEQNYIRSPWHLHSCIRSAWHLRMQIYILQNAIQKSVDMRYDLLNTEEFM